MLVGLLLIIALYTARRLKTKQLVVLFVGSLGVDLISGWTIGWTSLFIMLAVLILRLYLRWFRLRLNVQLVFLFLFWLAYRYVSTRFFL